jgi:membrane-associated phospholipid phosphatase
VAVLSAFTIIGAAYTYVMTYLGAGLPLWDARFLAADAALGLDWKSYLVWMNLHPLLGWALNSAYESILTQTFFLILLLVVLGQHRRLQGFILAAQLCIIVCGAAAAVMPALGPYPFFEVSATVDHPNIPLTTMNGHVAQVLQLRGSAPFLQLDSIEGIIVCPSFHMALAVLFAWAFWRVPFVRWIALMLNIVMAAGTPLSGGHYFIDIVAGAVLAFIAIAVVSSLERAIDRIASGRKASASPVPRASPIAHSGV